MALGCNPNLHMNCHNIAYRQNIETHAEPAQALQRGVRSRLSHRFAPMSASKTTVHPFLDGMPFIAMAHRGGAAEHPENSYSAFKHAVDLGYAYIETDVRCTRDDVVMIHHDPTLGRTLSGDGLVQSRSWKSISAMEHTNGDNPMRLTDALEAFPDTRFNIDCKDDRTLLRLVPTLEALGPAVLERICLASFEDRRVAAIQRHFGRKVATSAGQREVAAWWRSSYGMRKVVRTRAIAAQVPLRKYGLNVLSNRFLATAARLGCQVHAWTIDDRATMERLIDHGVHGIMTDRPTVLREVLRERGLWHQ